MGCEDQTMLIISLKKHFPARFPEWMISGVLITWGTYVVLHPEIFVEPATREMYAGLASMTWGLSYNPAALWGLSALFVGVIRAAALFINGAYTRTPLIRLVMSFASAFIWTQVTVGLLRSGVPNPGLIIYSWLVAADLASAYRAGTDVAYAEKQRHDNITELRRVKHHRSSQRVA